MLGLNKTISIYSTTRAITASGSAHEAEPVPVATGVRCAIQSNMLSNLPPIPQQHSWAGEMRKQEFRCWIPRRSISVIRENYIIVDEVTGEEYRVTAVDDEAGRAHHWILRVELYS